MIEAIAAETGLAGRRSGPIRRRPALARGPRAVDALPWVRDLRQPRGPVAWPCATRSGSPDRTTARATRDHDGHRRAPRRPLSGRRRGGGGLPGPLLRRDPRDDGRGLARSCWRGRVSNEIDLTDADRGATGTGVAGPRPGPAPIRGNGAAKCALDIALHDLAGKVLGMPVHELLELPAGPAADRLHDRHRRARDRRRAGPASGRLPGPQDQVRRPGRPRDAPSGPRGLRRPDPGRCQHRLDRGRTRETLLPELVDLGVELIEQPFPARGLPGPRLAPGALDAADRGRRECRRRRGPRGARRRRRRAST